MCGEKIIGKYSHNFVRNYEERYQKVVIGTIKIAFSAMMLSETDKGGYFYGKNKQSDNPF